MPFAVDPAFVLLGFAVGFVVGLTGVGGGSLMTPLLVLLFGFHPATAVGTDLFFAATTKAASTLVHGATRSVEWRVVGLLALGSVPAAVVTLAGLEAAGIASDEVSVFISSVLGLMLVLTAFSMLFRPQLARLAIRVGEPSPAVRSVATIAFGAVIGALVSLSSVGAGALGVVVLMILYPRLPIHRIVGTDIAHAVPLTLVAGIGHWLVGDVRWLMLASLLIGSLPGVLISSVLAPRIRELPLRLALAVILAIVGLKLLRS